MQDTSVGEAGWRLKTTWRRAAHEATSWAFKCYMAAHQNLKPKTPRPNCTNSQPLNPIPELHYPNPSIVHRHQGLLHRGSGGAPHASVTRGSGLGATAVGTRQRQAGSGCTARRRGARNEASGKHPAARRGDASVPAGLRATACAVAGPRGVAVVPVR
jgi:hypothetical protein